MCIDLKEYAHVLKDAAPYCCFKRANCALSLPYKYFFYPLDQSLFISNHYFFKKPINKLFFSLFPMKFFL